MANTKSDSFRTYYANGAGFSMADNDFRLILGVNKPEAPGDLHEELEVFMAHSTMKMVYLAMKTIIEHTEETTGREIYVDPTRVELFRKMIAGSPIPSSAVSPRA